VIALFLALAFAGEDGQLWTSVGAEARVTDSVGISLEQGFRGVIAPRDDLEVLSQVGVEVELAKHWSLSASYRMTALVPAAPLEHRLALDLKQSLKAGDFRFKFRQRYTWSLGEDGRHTLRPRVLVELKRKRIRPYLAAEAFVRIEKPIRFHKMRFTAGSKFRFKPWTFGPFFHLEQQLDGDRSYIGGLDVSVDLDFRRSDN
jgi:hypothetical protein